MLYRGAVRDNNDENMPVGAPLESVKIPGDLILETNQFAISNPKEKVFPPYWSGWMPEGYTFRMLTGSGVASAILATNRSSGHKQRPLLLAGTCFCNFTHVK